MKARVFCGLLALGLTGFSALVGCEQSANSNAPAQAAGEPASQPGASDSGLPGGLWLASEPADARPVGEIKKKAAAGQNVVVFGRIGGSRDPFVSGRAMFTLADRSLPSCTEKHGPGCETPWDYCCEPKENVLANTITVQVVGADGKPLRVALSNVHSLKPLSNVVVTGKVSSAGVNVVIDTQGIYVKQ